MGKEISVGVAGGQFTAEKIDAAIAATAAAAAACKLVFAMYELIMIIYL